MTAPPTAAATLKLIREAMAAARANDKPKTRRLLIDAVRLDPSNEQAWQWLAGVAETPLEATVALDRVLALNPNNEKARAAVRQTRLQAGIAAAKAKDAAAARKLLRRVVSDDPTSELGWLWLAGVCELAADALVCLNRVLALNPANETAKKGVAYYQARQAAQAQVDNPTPFPRSTPTVVAPVVRSRTPTPPPVRVPPPRPRTVLVVDDSRTIRKLAAVTMTGAGFRVVEAEDGMEAIEKLREEGIPDLVLLDVAMPGMDGYEFCRLLRQNPETAKVPVVMLTGKDGFFDKLRGRLAGTSAYLPKPLQPDALLRTVDKVCPAAAK